LQFDAREIFVVCFKNNTIGERIADVCSKELETSSLVVGIGILEGNRPTQLETSYLFLSPILKVWFYEIARAPIREKALATEMEAFFRSDRSNRGGGRHFG
jgi:hypothetical protein